MSKVFVYSALTGDYELPRAKGVPYMTDDPFKDPRRSARMHKCLTPDFEKYDFSIWIDANTSLKADPHWLAMTFLKDADIAVFKHPIRDCIYEEAKACQILNLDDYLTIDKQMGRYKEQGYPEHAGLAATTYILRRHTPQVEEFNNMWWAEICKGSRRDQLSFNYVAWKLGMKIKYFSEEVYFDNFKHNDYFNYWEHQKYEIQ